MGELDPNRAARFTVDQHRPDHRPRPQVNDSAFGQPSSVGTNRRSARPVARQYQAIEVEPGFDLQLNIAIRTVARQRGRRLLAQATLRKRWLHHARIGRG